MFGKEFLDGLRPLDFSAGPYRISGYASAPQAGVSGRNRQFFTVNGRPVREKTLQAAFNNTFEPFLEKSRSAAGVIDLVVPPDQIDVNIHPMKLEIRFLDPQLVYHLLRQAIHAALGGLLRPEARATHAPADMAQEGAMPVMIPTTWKGRGLAIVSRGTNRPRGTTSACWGSISIRTSWSREKASCW